MRWLPFGQPAGPTCYFWTGDVTFVADGDTIDVDIHGDGNSTPAAIRFIGINAMGLRTYSSYPERRAGECHGVDATARVEALIKAGGGVVRLSAQNPASKSGTRLRRSVAVRINGVWTDIGSVLTREGTRSTWPTPSSTRGTARTTTTARSLRPGG